MRLLLVNDEALTADTMKKDIQWNQYGISRVDVAYSVAGAKNIIESGQIDLILCDIEMPEQNGLELLAWIREESREIECIFLTCHASFHYAKQAIELGCQNYILIPARYEEIGKVVLKTVQLIKQKEAASKMQAYGKQIYYEKIENAVEQNNQNSPQILIDQAVHYILENLESPDLTVNAVAEVVHVHPVYLNRIFKKEKGIAISQFMIRERMQLAAELLKGQKLSLYAIAESVGYCSYSSFNTTFRKYYGCSPKQYAENGD